MLARVATPAAKRDEEMTERVSGIARAAKEAGVNELVWIAVACTGWYVLGCMVLAAIDDEQESLRLWARSGPLGEGGVVLVVMLWPVVWWMNRPSRRKEGGGDE